MYPKLVICIPTYNRSKVIDNVLGCELQMFKEHCIDVILYDSSEGTETENVYESYRKKGLDNLFFKKIDSKIASNQKIYMIWQDMEHSKYDYVWLIHDHRICSKNGLEYILQALEDNKDFYILDILGNTKFENVGIQTKNDFFHKGAVLLTLYGASIINIKTFILGTDWKKLKGKYLEKDSINFSQLGFYFDRADQMESISVSLLQLPSDTFKVVQVNEQGVSGWYNDAIRIWAQCWASTILKLPASYNGKKEVIRDNERLHLSRKNLIDYRKHGVYNCYIFFRYVKWIHIASSENILHYFFIAIAPPEFAAKVYQWCFIRQLKKICRKNKKIVIFGAGKYAFACAELMKKKQIPFDAFVVSSMKNNTNVLLGHPVLLAEEYLAREKNVLVIIAVAGYGNRKEIENYLDEINRKADRIYFEKYI